jgi:hypothetical protein
VFFGLASLPEAIKELATVAKGAVLGAALAILVARRRFARRKPSRPGD